MFSNVCLKEWSPVSTIKPRFWQRLEWSHLKTLTLSQKIRFCVSTVFLDQCPKKIITRYKLFVLFPQRFLAFWRIFHSFHPIQTCLLQTFSIWDSLKFVVWERVKVKGENATNQGFTAFSTMLSAFPKTKLIYLSALQKLSIRINLNLHCLVELNDGKQFRKTACSSFSAMFWKSFNMRMFWKWLQ